LAKKRKILYAVLDWGLGHATRSLPIIRELAKNNDVTVLSTGRSLNLIKNELPDLNFIDHTDYSVKYTRKGGSLIFFLALQIPKILLKLKEEHSFAEKLVEEQKFDRIISDNRYGIYSNNIPSYFITHQLKFKLPKGFEKLEFISEYFNKRYFRRYRKVFIPDSASDQNFSGSLSHDLKSIKSIKLTYTGILADIDSGKEEIKSDYLIIISGPEPQRTMFEKIAVEQAAELKGKTIIVCGKPESSKIMKSGNIEVYGHASRKELSAMVRGTGLIISRPGYSSVMEIVSLNKKALFIPTPGQTEQEYLADYYKEKKYFYSVSQDKMDLKNDVMEAVKLSCPIRIEPNNIGGLINEVLS